MTRINALCNITKSSSFQAISGTLNALVFAAVLVVCSIAVGCSSDKPKPVSSNTQISMTQPAPALSPAPVAPPAPKPIPKKSAPKKPATVNYTDKANGVTFEYPRRYAIDTGDAAASLVLSHPVPMNFVAPGGTALAAVELPETGFDNTDFSSAFFSVSVHKALTAEQCTEFAAPFVEKTNIAPVAAKADNTRPAPSNPEAKEVKPEPKDAAPVVADHAKPAEPSSAEAQASSPANSAKPSDSPTDSKSNEKVEASVEPSSSPSTDVPSSVDLKTLTLQATETVSGEGTRQSDSRYFHVYQNGSCYEFALNVTTNANGDGLTKHIDREKVFARLEKILDSVKLEDVKPTVAAEPSAAPQPAGTPAQ